MNLRFPFEYDEDPSIRVVVHSRLTGLTDEIEARIDTGVQMTLFDLDVANRLEIELARAPRIGVNVVAGFQLEGRIAPLRDALLQLPELMLDLEVVFAERVARSTGNLLGLNVLRHFDIALSHSQRLGFLGPAAR